MLSIVILWYSVVQGDAQCYFHDNIWWRVRRERRGKSSDLDKHDRENNPKISIETLNWFQYFLYHLLIVLLLFPPWWWWWIRRATKKRNENFLLFVSLTRTGFLLFWWIFLRFFQNLSIWEKNKNSPFWTKKVKKRMIENLKIENR